MWTEEDHQQTPGFTLRLYTLHCIAFLRRIFIIPPSTPRSLFLSVLSLRNLCRCRGLLLYLITLSDTHTHTLGRTPLDEESAHRRDLLRDKHNTHETDIHAPADSNPQFQQASGRRTTPSARPPGSGSRSPNTSGFQTRVLNGTCQSRNRQLSAT